MQTFLPYADFIKTARCLDNKRLGKQRVEAWQIYTTISENKKAWSNHPAVNMWRGYERFLLYYGDAICTEWILRGFKDSMLARFRMFGGECVIPPWFGNMEFHKSHQSNLLRKDYGFYSKYGWEVPADLPYIWPIN